MRQVWNIAVYEVMHILNDKILTLMVLFVPLMYTAIFGLVYVSGILTDIPLGIVDLDHSKLSYEVVESFSNTQYFKVIPEVSSYPELEQAMKTGVVRAGIIIPSDFGNQVSEHRLSKVQMVYDSSNLIWGYNTRKYALTVVNQFYQNHAATYLAGMGYTKWEINNTLDTVSMNSEIWYNPTFNYCIYLFPGLLMLILHQIGILSISLTVTREKEQHCWLHYLSSPVPKWRIFVGKGLPYFLINFFNYALLLWISNCFINVKIEGSLGLIILMGILYVAIITSTGFVISIHSGDSLAATRLLMLLSLPVFICSGYTWPKTLIPSLINGIIRLLPYPWMADGYRLVSLKGAGLDGIALNLMVLVIMAGIMTFLAVTFPKRRKPFAEGKSSHFR